MNRKNKKIFEKNFSEKFNLFFRCEYNRPLTVSNRLSKVCVLVMGGGKAGRRGLTCGQKSRLCELGLVCTVRGVGVLLVCDKSICQAKFLAISLSHVTRENPDGVRFSESTIKQIFALPNLLLHIRYTVTA